MFPARVAIGWFVPSDMAIGGIKGSVWNGSATEVSVNGIYLRDVKWSLNVFQSLTGAASYSVEATPVSGFFESDVAIGFDGTLSMSEMTAALPLAIFANSSGLPGLQGSASLAFERVQFVAGLAIVADGTIQVANLIVPIVGRDSLGGYTAEFYTQNNGISASVEDTDGVLDLAGSFQLRTDRSYEFVGLVIAKPETPQGVRNQLRFLPPANELGQQELRLEGIL